MEEIVCNARIVRVEWSRPNGDIAHKLVLEGDNWTSEFYAFPLTGDNAVKWLKALMNMFELREMSDDDLVGKIIRVSIKDNTIVSIGHPYKNIWINPKELLNQIEKEEEKKDNE